MAKIKRSSWFYFVIIVIAIMVMTALQQLSGEIVCRRARPENSTRDILERLDFHFVEYSEGICIFTSSNENHPWRGLVWGEHHPSFITLGDEFQLNVSRREVDGKTVVSLWNDTVADGEIIVKFGTPVVLIPEEDLDVSFRHADDQAYLIEQDGTAARVFELLTAE